MHSHKVSPDSVELVVTLLNVNLFMQCKVLSLSVTEEGSSWLPKHLKKCEFSWLVCNK